MTQIFFIFSLFLFFCSFAFSPMSQTLEFSSAHTQVQYLVDNPTDEPMAVEISLRERVQKADGTEEMLPTTDLAAFPPQLIVPPKEKRSIRVNYLGPKLKAERAYRVVAEQLPIDVDGKKRKGSGIKMLLKYVAALYVDPGETSAKLAVKVLESTDKGLRISVANDGSAHAPLNKPTLVLVKGAKKLVLTTEQLKGLAGENVLAGVTRTFDIAPVKDVDASFSGTLTVE